MGTDFQLNKIKRVLEIKMVVIVAQQWKYT